MHDYIFDILGITSREDSYSNLIAHAFLNSSDFRNNFLTLIKKQHHQDWEVLLRPPITIVSERGKRKDIPDLIVFNKILNEVILIENKVFSGEGWMQTERYASIEFKNRLANYLNINKPKFTFFFLNLGGEMAHSTEFKTISYLDISKCISGDFNKTKLNILLTEFNELINEYSNWPLPRKNEIVLDYLKNNKRLVDSYRTFHILSENLINPKYGMLMEYGKTANRGSGFIPLRLWYKKSWVSKNNLNNMGKKVDIINNYNIHFEFQWDTRSDWENITLFLHYHTNPYKTKKELELFNMANYNDTRNRFFHYLKNKKLRGWKINKTVLRVAYWSFYKTITYGELEKEISSLVSDMIPQIDSFVKSI